jgi:predicted dehydrogenase
MEVIGEKGTVVWDYTAQTVQLYGRHNNQCQVYLENINTELNSMYVQEMEHFVRCVEGAEKPLVDAREGRVVVELIEAARLSSRQGKVVCLPLEAKG